MPYNYATAYNLEKAVHYMRLNPRVNVQNIASRSPQECQLIVMFKLLDFGYQTEFMLFMNMLMFQNNTRYFFHVDTDQEKV